MNTRINPGFTQADFESIQKLAKLKDRPMAYLVRQWALEGLERERKDIQDKACSVNMKKFGD